MGWLIPRNLIVLTNYLILNKYIVEIPHTDKIAALLACGLIGLASSRGHWKHPSQQVPQSEVNERRQTDTSK